MGIISLRQFSDKISKIDTKSILQAPNSALSWSKRQKLKSDAIGSPRFVDIDIKSQPAPLSAQELVKMQPVEITDKRVIFCNGGSETLGHPKVFINLDNTKAGTCGYCGKRFQKSNILHNSH